MADTRANNQIRFGAGLYCRAVVMSIQFTEILSIDLRICLLEEVRAPIGLHAEQHTAHAALECSACSGIDVTIAILGRGSPTADLTNLEAAVAHELVGTTAL